MRVRATSMPLLAGETFPKIDATSGRPRTALRPALMAARSMRSCISFASLLLLSIKATAQDADEVQQMSMLGNHFGLTTSRRGTPSSCSLPLHSGHRPRSFNWLQWVELRQPQPARSCRSTFFNCWLLQPELRGSVEQLR